MLWGYRKREHLNTIGENVNCHTVTMENTMEVAQKIKNRTTVWSSHLTLGYILKGSGIDILKRYLCSHVHCNISHNSEGIEITKMSINRWIKKMWYTHTHTHTNTHNGILLSLEKEGKPVICDNMAEPKEHYVKMK